MQAWGSTSIEALFVGTAMVATSVGITARVLSGMGLLDAPTARIILGAAVIDDILGLLVLAIVSSMAAGTVNYLEILTTAGLRSDLPPLSLWLERLSLLAWRQGLNACAAGRGSLSLV